MAGVSKWFRTGLVAAGFLLSGTGCVIEITDLGDDVRRADEEASELYTRTLTLDQHTSFRLVGANGTVRIFGEEGLETLEIRALRTVWSDTRRDAREHLHLLRVLVSDDGEEVMVETDQPRDTNGRNYEVDYEIRLPSFLAVEVVNGNGSIRIQGLEDGVVVEVGNGDVSLDSVEGPVFVAVGNGRVEVGMFLPHGDQAVFAVGNGSVDLAVQPEVSARLNARVGNGTISVTGLSLQDQISGTGQLSGLLGSGAGLIDLSVGNGWVAVKGG